MKHTSFLGVLALFFFPGVFFFPAVVNAQVKITYTDAVRTLDDLKKVFYK